MYRFVFLLIFCCSSVVAYFGVALGVGWFESQTEAQISSVLVAQNVDWMEVEADGMSVKLSGFAPDEGSHLHVLEAISGIISTSRLSDTIEIDRNKRVAPPQFSLEILRNDDEISLIGLVPKSAGRQGILDLVDDLSKGQKIADMLETADYPVSEKWSVALTLGGEILRRLPRSKISVTADKIIVSAIADSLEEKRAVTEFLNQEKTRGIMIETHITSPREVIAPFVFRLNLSDGRAQLDICSADSETAQTRILQGLEKFDMITPPICDVGLGVPTPDWADVVLSSLDALYNMGAGVVTMTDFNIRFVASSDVDEGHFERVVARLRDSLPRVFSLNAVLPPPVVVDDETGESDIPEFIATMSPEGQAQLRGRVDSPLAQNTTDILAQSLFGTKNVHQQARVDNDLPQNWSRRVMASLLALDMLHNGIVTMNPNQIEVKGMGKTATSADDVLRILSQYISNANELVISVDYDEKLVLKEVVDIEPLECAEQIDAILAEEKIIFKPSSAELGEDGLAIAGLIAAVLRTCPDVYFEIEGHTDSQGREELNRSISQKRAEAVLFALLNERIVTTNLRAKGYGPDRPIADNKTAVGRAANRRIEFSLLLQETLKHEEAKLGEDPVINEEIPSETTTEISGETTDEIPTQAIPEGE